MEGDGLTSKERFNAKRQAKRDRMAAKKKGVRVEKSEISSPLVAQVKKKSNVVDFTKAKPERPIKKKQPAPSEAKAEKTPSNNIKEGKDSKDDGKKAAPKKSGKRLRVKGQIAQHRDSALEPTVEKAKSCMRG